MSHENREPTRVGLALFVLGACVSLVAVVICIGGALWYHSLLNPITNTAFGVLVGSEVLWVGSVIFGAKKETK